MIQTTRTGRESGTMRAEVGNRLGSPYIITGSIQAALMIVGTTLWIRCNVKPPC
jgi:hypothetical protein